MTTYIMNIGKLGAHIILVGISALLSVNLFIKLGVDIVSKTLLSMMAGSLEIMKIWLFVHGKYLLQKKGEGIRQRFNYRSAATFTFMLYLALAVLSAIASVGYSISTVEQQSFTVATSNFEVDMLLEEIEANKRQIEIIQENATGLDFSAVERVAKANEQIKVIQDKNKELMKEVRSLREEKGVEKQKANDIFTALGGYIDRDGKYMMKLILLLLSILLEITIVVSSPNEENVQRRSKIKVESKSKGKRNEYEWEPMIRSLFSTGGSPKLKPLPKVAKETGYPLDVVKQMRNTLMEVRHEKRPLIYKKESGAMYANVDREKILHIARNYL